MGVDRSKALADYSLFSGNAFWLYMLEQMGEKIRQEQALLVSADSMPDIYRAQGRAAVWEMVSRLPKDLLERLTRTGSGEGRP